MPRPLEGTPRPAATSGIQLMMLNLRDRRAPDHPRDQRGMQRHDEQPGPRPNSQIDRPHGLLGKGLKVRPQKKRAERSAQMDCDQLQFPAWGDDDDQCREQAGLRHKYFGNRDKGTSSGGHDDTQGVRTAARMSPSSESFNHRGLDRQIPACVEIGQCTDRSLPSFLGDWGEQRGSGGGEAGTIPCGQRKKPEKPSLRLVPPRPVDARHAVQAINRSPFRLFRRTTHGRLGRAALFLPEKADG